MPGKSGRITYYVDARDDIVSVEGDWDKFAVANDAPELVAAKVVGSCDRFCSQAIISADARFGSCGKEDRVRVPMRFSGAAPLKSYDDLAHAGRSCKI
jgi:hypothetical protein